MKALNLVTVATEIKNNSVSSFFSSMEEMAGKRSFFKFHITQNVQEIINQILHGQQENWFGYRNEENRRQLVLVDSFSGCRAYALILNSGLLEITCRNGRYSYVISNDPNGGATVEFNGSFAALLQQEILPEMSYVPETLQAQYEGMPYFLNIKDYCRVRYQRNGDETAEGEQINAKFNNEIPCFAKAEIVAEKKAA